VTSLGLDTVTFIFALLASPLASYIPLPTKTFSRRLDGYCSTFSALISAGPFLA